MQANSVIFLHPIALPFLLACLLTLSAGVNLQSHTPRNSIAMQLTGITRQGSCPHPRSEINACAQSCSRSSGPGPCGIPNCCYRIDGNIISVCYKTCCGAVDSKTGEQADFLQCDTNNDGASTDGGASNNSGSSGSSGTGSSGTDSSDTGSSSTGSSGTGSSGSASSGSGSTGSGSGTDTSGTNAPKEDSSDGPKPSVVPPSSSSSCFPRGSLIELESGSMKHIEDLDVGDRVKVSHGLFSDVFMFTHKSSSSRSAFVVIRAESGNVITLTAGHYIYLNGYLAPSGTAKVGDEIILGNGMVTKVIRISTRMDNGLFNPQTIHGDIVVNGIVASTYTTAVSPHFGHSWLMPARVVYRFFGKSGGVFENGAESLASVLPDGPMQC